MAPMTEPSTLPGGATGRDADGAAAAIAPSDAAPPMPAIEAAPSAAGEERQLDPRVIAMQRVTGAIVSSVLAAATGVGAISAWVANGASLLGLLFIGTLWLLFNGASLWHFRRWPAIAYRHTWYRVDARGLEIRRGVIWRGVTNVPRSRVQHTDVAQGPLDRRYGLGTLVVHTAGTDHAKVMLEGLDHGVALAIREQLMPERGSDAV
jgi:membrane protein YdbS with pleckstrin-like domain